VYDIQHIPLIPHFVASMASKCMHVSKVVSNPDIDADIPSMQQENLSCKNHT
jgi:hypothetical protein